MNEGRAAAKPEQGSNRFAELQTLVCCSAVYGGWPGATRSTFLSVLPRAASRLTGAKTWAGILMALAQGHPVGQPLDTALQADAL